MDILGNSDEPGVELKFGVVCSDFIKSFGERFYGNVFGIRFVFGAFEHKAVDFIPVMVE